MAEGGYDPCECIWNHEAAMRRLMGLLRDSQQTCSDSQCDLNLPGPDPAQDGNYFMMLMMMGWLVLALVLFIFRPSSMRGQRGDDKPRPLNQDPGPPAPSVD